MLITEGDKELLKLIHDVKDSYVRHDQQDLHLDNINNTLNDIRTAISNMQNDDNTGLLAAEP